MRDTSSDAPLPGATVYLAALERGASTDPEGHFSLSVPSGQYRVTVTYVGYESYARQVDLTRDRVLTVALKRKLIPLEGVSVTAKAAEQNVKSTEMGVTRLKAQELEDLPAFLGEVDVMRSLLLLPGVSNVGDGANGINVRGGNVDQNLILFENSPLYYSSHLFGFFSPFNPAVVEDVTLYRGAIPATLGGRLSSVLKVDQREGSKKDYNFRGGVGLVSSRLAVDGPLIKDKMSFLVGGRVSYVNWLLHHAPNKDVRNSNARFYDFNAGVNYQFDDKNRIETSGYFSHDGFEFAADTLYQYSTANFSARWKHLFSDQLFTDLTFASSDYDYSVKGQQSSLEFDLSSSVRHRNLRANVTWLPTGRHTIDAGLDGVYYHFDPGDIRPNAEGSSVNAKSIEDERALETAFYVNDQFEVNDRLSLMGGLRFSTFLNLGPGTSYVFEPGATRKVSTITDTLSYGAGEVMKSYFGLAPRFSLRYQLGEKHSVKLSYTRTRQYVHRISNTTAVTPQNVWKSSGPNLPAQAGGQVSLGYFRNFMDGNVTSSVEAYYKRIHNPVDYKAGAKLLLNSHLITELLSGEGRAYGVELMVRRHTGNLTGWLGYTYSRSQRRVNGDAEEERINFGDYYPANFDRPHEVTLALSYKDTPRLIWNINFVYRTGRPITYPESKFVIDGIPVANFSERNQHRVPAYHRLDLSVKFDNRRVKDRGWNGSWTFSIYNVYGRRNPYSIFFGRKNGGAVPQAYRLSTLGAIFPSLTYSFEF